MPIPLNLPNFLQAPIQKTDYSGLSNLPMKLAEAYQMPMKMQQGQEDRELKNKLLTAKTAYANAMAQNAGKTATSDLEKLMNSAKSIESKYGKGSPEYIYAQQYLQSKLKSEHGQSPSNKGKEWDEWQRIEQSDMTPEQKKMARSHYGFSDPLSPEAQKDIETNIPKEARGQYFGDLTPAQIQIQSKIMENDLQQAQIMQETLPEIKKGLEITKKNPNLWKSWAQHLQKMEDLGEYGFSDWLHKNTTLNDKDKSELSLLNKITNTIVRNESMIDKLKGGTGSRSSDLITRIIERGKASSENPGDVNEYIFNALIDRYKIGKPWGDALRTGIMNNVRVVSNPSAFKKIADKNSVDRESQQREALRRPAHKLKNVTWQAVDETARKRGITREQVLKTLKLSPEEIKE